MPVLPLIDLMILLAWTCLAVAFGEKAVALVTAYPRAVLFGLTPFDWVISAVAFLMFALALAARVWVKAHEPGLLRLRHERARGGFEVLPDFPDPREQARLAQAGRRSDDETTTPTRIAAR